MLNWSHRTIWAPSRSAALVGTRFAGLTVTFSVGLAAVNESWTDWLAQVWGTEKGGIVIANKSSVRDKKAVTSIEKVFVGW
jgi:hypothetical protein